MVPRVRRVDAATVASFRRRRATRAGVARVCGFESAPQDLEPRARRLGSLHGRRDRRRGRGGGQGDGADGADRRGGLRRVAPPRRAHRRLVRARQTGVPAVATRARVRRFSRLRRRGEKAPRASRRRGSGRRRRARRQALRVVERGGRRGARRVRPRDGRHVRVCPTRPTEAFHASVCPTRGGVAGRGGGSSRRHDAEEAREGVRRVVARHRRDGEVQRGGVGEVRRDKAQVSDANGDARVRLRDDVAAGT
mmetsp:Transcript_13481/g.57050  ORF Transcript_13481/g.57050 Transcript_13481/m.57050 type:complete len:251 (+) Transcript_13481:806-1558(+)